jgi:cobalt/nickel transport system permease protein
MLSKSMALSNDVYLAMQSRGFRGEVKIIAEFRMTLWDYLALPAFLLVSMLAVWMGR